MPNAGDISCDLQNRVFSGFLLLIAEKSKKRVVFQKRRVHFFVKKRRFLDLQKRCQKPTHFDVKMWRFGPVSSNIDKIDVLWHFLTKHNKTYVFNVENWKFICFSQFFKKKKFLFMIFYKFKILTSDDFWFYKKNIKTNNILKCYSQK